MNKAQHQQIAENLFKTQATSFTRCIHTLPKYSCTVCNDTRGSIDGLSGEEEQGALNIINNEK